MAIIMPIENGQIPNAGGTSTEKEKTQAQQNKDMFLQLLVAEMQYQDPLEPTDNSEYIQQLYSMSQTESILSVQQDMENMSARNLVGKYVTVQDELTGETFDGKVDTVAEVGGVQKVSINGELYEISRIKQVHDEAYFVAVSAADTLTGIVQKMPSVENLRVGHKEDLQKALDVYNSMNDYAKGFLTKDTVNKLTDLVERMNQLVKAQGGSSETEEADKTDAPEESEITEEKAEEVAESEETV